MMAASTTIIFVPGAWHSPECYRKLLQPLQAEGYNTSLVYLPTINPSVPQPDWSADVTAIKTAIKTAADSGQKVRLVVHSYGGLPGSEAVKDLDWKTRERNSLPGGVTHLLYVCAFIVPLGQSLLRAVGGKDLPWWDVSPDRRTMAPLTPEKIFYNDLPPESEEVRTAVAALSPQSYQAFGSEVTYEAWRDVPTTYLYCLRDQAIDIGVQRKFVEDIARGAGIRTESVDAGHSPFYSAPEELVKVIKRAAGEKV
ncbi:alpha/beta-hydrolase [Aspergillus granulosus]|uniref:Alpha/beta-hydrolase n=1 Tax=Aspergillus granulosus TaxID=176169 RepID=A0ABR4GTU0_9EURO